MRSELQDTWLTAFPDSPPLRHILRRAYATRWLRVHSLSDAKRLPTGPEDEREVLHRQQVVANRILSIDGECTLVVAYANGYRGEDEPSSLTAFGPQVAEGWAERWLSDARLADDLEDMAFAVSTLIYRPGLLAPLILDVAYGRTASLLFFHHRTGRVYSPYDGGADLFFDSPDARDEARRELSEWISRRPDGL